LGLSKYQLEITSLGDLVTRENYLKELRAYIETLSLDEEMRNRAVLNPLRLFDDKRPEVKELVIRLGIDFVVNNRMVRGLDYYPGTAFEFVHNELGAQTVIGGGGRYDGLMAQLGGKELSGIGFGLGLDRILLACEAEGIEMPEGFELDLYIVPLGTGDEALIIAEELRERGLRVDLAFGDKALKGGMKSADRSGAKYSVVLGADELSSGSIQLKEMETGVISSVTLSALANELIERISNFGDFS